MFSKKTKRHKNSDSFYMSIYIFLNLLLIEPSNGCNSNSDEFCYTVR